MPRTPREEFIAKLRKKGGIPIPREEIEELLQKKAALQEEVKRTPPEDVNKYLLLDRAERWECVSAELRNPDTSPERCRDLLRAWWTDREVGGGMTDEETVKAFRRAGFICDSDGYVLPTEPFTIYRGCRPAFVEGVSWTLDRDVADWFAERFSDDDARVYAATIRPEGVLGVFLQERNEEEVVIDPAQLIDVAEVTEL